MNNSFIILGTEYRRSRHDGIGARADHLGHVARLDATVHLYDDTDALFIQKTPRLTDLAKLAPDEALTSEAWIDGHDEQQVHVVQDVLHR